MPKPVEFIPQTFRIFRRSENRNSFCLREYWMINKDGVAFTACRASDLPLNCEVTLMKHPTSEVWDGFASLGFEIPERRTPNAPAGVVKDVFAIKVVKADLGAYKYE